MNGHQDGEAKGGSRGSGACGNAASEGSSGMVDAPDDRRNGLPCLLSPAHCRCLPPLGCRCGPLCRDQPLRDGHLPGHGQRGRAVLLPWPLTAAANTDSAQTCVPGQ